jgi:Cdc25 family phosphatase
MSKLQKSADGQTRNSLGEVVVSQPTLLTTESPQTKPSLQSLPGQVALEKRAPDEPEVASTSQLLKVAEKERMAENIHAVECAHRPPFEPQPRVQEPHIIQRTQALQEPIATTQHMEQRHQLQSREQAHHDQQAYSLQQPHPHHIGPTQQSTQHASIEPSATVPSNVFSMTGGQSSPEYKYKMTQLLRLAEEERARKHMHATDRTHMEPLTHVQQHRQPVEPQITVQEPQRMPQHGQAQHHPLAREQIPIEQQGYSLQDHQLQHTSPTRQLIPIEPLATATCLQHSVPHHSFNQGHQKQPTEPTATTPQPMYQTSSTSRFQQIPNPVPLSHGVDRLDPVVVQQFLKSRQCILVDVRGDDRVAGTIEGAIHVPAIDAVPFALRLQECVRQWKNKPLVIFHCQYSAHRAPQCANLYKEQAPQHQRVAVMDGGFRGWESLGLPVQQGIQGLDGQHSTNMYALQQGMQFAHLAQHMGRFK